MLSFGAGKYKTLAPGMVYFLFLLAIKVSWCEQVAQRHRLDYLYSKSLSYVRANLPFHLETVLEHPYGKPTAALHPIMCAIQ